MNAKHVYFLHGIYNPLPMVYRTPYPWCNKPPTYGILNPQPKVYQPHIHGISNPLPMVFWTTYPCFSYPTTRVIMNPSYQWYIEPLTHGILYPYQWYNEPPTHGISNPFLWYYETALLIKMRRFNLPWCGYKYHDRNFILGSKYHIYIQSWSIVRGSKYHMTPIFEFYAKCRPFVKASHDGMRVQWDLCQTGHWKRDCVLRFKKGIYAHGKSSATAKPWKFKRSR